LSIGIRYWFIVSFNFSTTFVLLISSGVLPATISDIFNQQKRKLFYELYAPLGILLLEKTFPPRGKYAAITFSCSLLFSGENSR